LAAIARTKGFLSKHSFIRQVNDEKESTKKVQFEEIFSVWLLLHVNFLGDDGNLLPGKW
jgi:hypothetical protein